MKALFMGSGTFGLPVLDALAASRHSLAAVVTAPDKPQGRGRALTPSPIKVWAEARGILVLTPLKLNAPESIDALRTVGAEVWVVASYGAILSSEALALPPRGAINVHPSLLPKYRGASPVVQALLEGERRTGMTIMAMAKDLDAGDILLQEPTEVGPDENARELTDRLARFGGRMTVEALDLLEAGRLTRTPQAHSQATYCSKLKKADSIIDWNLPAHTIHNRVRALAIWPGTVTSRKGRSVKILTTRLTAPSSDGTVDSAIGDSKPGQVLAVDPTQGILVRTGKGSLWLLEVQPEGARPMHFKDYLNGTTLKPGDRFE